MRESFVLFSKIAYTYIYRLWYYLYWHIQLAISSTITTYLKILQGWQKKCKDRNEYIHSEYLNSIIVYFQLCLLYFVAGSILKLILIKLGGHEVCMFPAFDYTVCGGNGRLRHKTVAAWRVNVFKFFIITSSLLINRMID